MYICCGLIVKWLRLVRLKPEILDYKLKTFDQDTETVVVKCGIIFIQHCWIGTCIRATLSVKIFKAALFSKNITDEQDELQDSIVFL